MSKKKDNISIENNIEELEAQYKKVPKRKWMFRLATLLFMVFSIFMATILSSRIDSVKNKSLNAYLNATDYETLNSIYDDIRIQGNNEAYSWFEENCLGIDNNIALAGFSNNCDANRDFYNAVSNVVAKCNVNRKVEIYVDGKNVYTSNDDVLEVIATPLAVYFIDSSSNNLLKFDVQTREINVFVDDKVEQFAIYGKYIFYLSSDEVLRRINTDSLETTEIATNVQRFFVSKDLIVQNETDIVKIGLDGAGYTKLIGRALLVGADYNHIYYTNFGVEPSEMKVTATENASNDGTETEEVREEIIGKYVVYAMNITQGDITPIDGRNEFIRAIYITENGILVDYL